MLRRTLSSLSDCLLLDVKRFSEGPATTLETFEHLNIAGVRLEFTAAITRHGQHFMAHVRQGPVIIMYDDGRVSQAPACLARTSVFKLHCPSVAPRLNHPGFAGKYWLTDARLGRRRAALVVPFRLPETCGVRAVSAESARFPLNTQGMNSSTFRVNCMTPSTSCSPKLSIVLRPWSVVSPSTTPCCTHWLCYSKPRPLRLACPRSSMWTSFMWTPSTGSSILSLTGHCP